jgi:hypothetical protein
VKSFSKQETKNMFRVKSLVIFLVLAVAVGGAVWFYVAEWGNVDVPVNPPVSQPPPPAEKKPVKENKPFVLREVNGSGVTGDGTATLKDTLTSIAIRLTAAPDLPAGEVYEVYAVIQEGTDPQPVGVLAKINGKNEKYLTAGAGLTSWYNAHKLIVTKRAKSAPVPGTIVAETSLTQK